MGKRNDANALPRRGDGAASHHQKVTRKEESIIVSKAAAPIIDSACKVFVNRIPATFTEESIVRLIQESVPGLPPDSIRDISLVYENENDEEKETNNAADNNNDDDRATSNKKSQPSRPHKGYAFLHLATAAAATILLQQQTIRGSATANSKKKHTIYLSAVADDRNAATFICFLWQQRRCPYGESCKFRHVGDGACGGPVVPASSASTALLSDTKTTSRAKTKCWEYLKKGSCRQGDDCLFWHPPPEEQCTAITAAGVATTTTSSAVVVVNDKEKTKRPDSEKDCINWKTKGKCRKRETTTCPYRHDENVRGKVLAKKQAEQQQTNNMKRPINMAGSEKESLDGGPPTKKMKKKTKQPLSVRVFGLNYESTMADVHDLFADCGAIQKVTFPTFDDSGRSKGYCEVLFTSPQAVDQALLLHETELHGRWLSVQAGKMLERQWQDHNQKNHHRGAAANEDGDGFLQE
jgi:RNA recognition motif. (a.k.a. RRM, RBD, or RNP domain)/RNA-binding, Nab2-type zinc finger